MGRADRTLPSKFHHRRRAAPLEPAGDPRVRPSEEVRGAGEPRARAIAQGEGRSHRPRGAGRDRRQARRRISARCVSDRVRHPNQYERQRGDRQPGDRDRRRRDRIQEADPPERRRQSQSIVERRVPDRDAHRLGGTDQAVAAAGGASTARYARRQGEGVLRCGDGRPHASAGRDAAHSGTGDFRLGGAARPGDRHDRAAPATGCCPWRSAGRRSAPG